MRADIDNKCVAMQETDVISQIIGNWGKWQFRSVFLIYLCKIPSAWFMACIIFTAPTPRYGEFFCKPIESGATINNASFFQEQINGKQLFDIDYCTEYDNETKCPSFLHDTDFISLVTQFDLVCSKTILVGVTQFFHLFGVLTGGILATKLLEM